LLGLALSVLILQTSYLVRRLKWSYKFKEQLSQWFKSCIA
jgi:hypothetical protein